jgi:hypothetical protein
MVVEPWPEQASPRAWIARARGNGLKGNTMTRRRFAARCGLLVAALGLAFGGMSSATAAPAAGDKAPAAEAGKPGPGTPEPGKPGPGKPDPGKPGPGKGCGDPGVPAGVSGTVASIDKKGDGQIVGVRTATETVSVLVTPKTIVVKDKPKDELAVGKDKPAGEQVVLKVGDKVMVKGFEAGKGVIEAVAVVVLT